MKHTPCNLSGPSTKEKQNSGESKRNKGLIRGNENCTMIEGKGVAKKGGVSRLQKEGGNYFCSCASASGIETLCFQ